MRRLLMPVKDQTAARAVYLTGLTGLTLSNNSGDATNDIDIAAGAAVSDDTTIKGRRVMILASALTKQLDVAWAAGSAAGGLFTGAIANTTYHVFLISNGSVVDAGFDTSATGANAPAGYTWKRRIGSIIRAGATILAFTQYGDEFVLTTPVLDYDNATPGTSQVTATLTVPVGLNVLAHVNVFYGVAAGLVLRSPGVTGAAVSSSASPLATVGGSSGNHYGVDRLVTNTSAQINFRAEADNAVRIATRGWNDLTRR